MKQYLLSVYHPETPRSAGAPPADVDQIIQDDDALNAALEWGRKATRACRIPVEVRPFQDEAEN